MYSAKVVEKVENRPGTWNSLKIGVFKGDEQIGEYIRNYSSLYRTFCHFTKNGKDYALYSKDYTSTRIMSLPDCKDIGGEERNSWGFCPTDYYVPSYRGYTYSFEMGGEIKTYSGLNYDADPREESDKYKYTTPVLHTDFGFIAGCVWGDDSSWKIQYLDLSRADEGIIKRDDRFGYIHLPEDMDLADAVQVEHGDSVKITIAKNYNRALLENNDYDSPDYHDPEDD